MINLKDLHNSRVLVADIEADGLLDTLTQTYCISIREWPSRKEVAFYSPSYVKYFNAEVLNDWDYIVFHNGIGYDHEVILRTLKVNIPKEKIIDTLVLSRLANPSREGGHGLDAWGKRLGEYKGDFHDWSRFSSKMSTYCRQDTRVGCSVLTAVVEELKDFSLESINLEHEVQWVIQEQIRNGVYFNEQKAYILLGKLLERKVDLEQKVHETFIPLPSKVREVVPKYKKDGVLSVVGIKAIDNCLETVGGPFTLIEWPKFNLGSRQQIAGRLQRLGWKPTKFTDKGSIIVDEEVLKHIEDIPEAVLIKEYMLVNKRVAQLNGPKKNNGTGGGWLTHVTDKLRVHGNVNSCGAVTGRMTHSSPNMAQVPAVYNPYGKECRDLFTVPKGYKLVGCDASGLELRMLAHYMNDKDYTETILNGDIHTANQEAAGLPTRDMAKTFIYAFLYGGGDARIGSIVGKGSKEGAGLKAKFLDNTPALKTLREKVLTAANRGFLKGLDGRKLWVRSPHAALNVLLQGGGAIVMKKALILVYQYAKEEGLDFKMVLNVHDEWQAEVREDQAPRFGELSVNAIRHAGDYYNFRCPLDGEYKEGDSWKETH
jgi:DNA polymerase I